MYTLILVCAGLASAIHVLIFCMESLWFMRPAVYHRFGAHNLEQAQAARLFAWNQGFYNLFLALGTLAGVVLAAGFGQPLVGYTLICFGCGCMLAASIVLLQSAPQMWRAALIQGLLPLIAIVSLAALSFASP